MPNIPTVPGADIDVATPAKAVPLNAGALSARFRGQQQFAGAVEGISDQLSDLQQNLQKVKQAHVAADVAFRTRAAQQSFIESTQGDENEGAWSDRAKEMTDKVRDDVFANNEIPPGMRQQVDDSLRNWGQSMQIKAQTMSHLQTINKATTKLKSAYDEAGRDGQADAMQDVVKLGRSSKLDPVMMDQWEQAIPRTVALTAIDQGLQKNPKGTYELLKSGASLPVKDQNGVPIDPKKVFPSKQLESLVNAARVQTAVWQKSNFEELQKDRDPVTGLVPEQAILQKMSKGEVEQKAGQNLIDAQARQTMAGDRDRYNVLNTKINNPTAWNISPEEYAHQLVTEAADIKSPALRDKAINEANRQYAAIKKKGQLEQGPIERKVMELMIEDRDSRGTMIPLHVQDVSATEGTPFISHQHRFGQDEQAVPGQPATTKYVPFAGGTKNLRAWLENPKTTPKQIEDAFGKGATRDTVLKSEQDQYAKVWNDMHDWFQSPQGQKATFEQANEQRQKLERPYVMEAVRQSLSKRAPANVTTKEELDALPSGAPIIWNGKIGVKN